MLLSTSDLINKLYIDDFVVVGTKMNDTSNGESFGMFQLVERLGLLFYVINPVKSSFEKVEDCPDYVNQVREGWLGDFEYSLTYQAIPFIALLIVLEAAVNHFVRNKTLNLADRWELHHSVSVHCPLQNAHYTLQTAQSVR